jgi:hypothetical protein
VRCMQTPPLVLKRSSDFSQGHYNPPQQSQK